MYLEDTPLDIGYASEKVHLSDINGKDHLIGGHSGQTQLIITTPFIDEAFIQELQKIGELIPSSQTYKVSKSLVVAHNSQSAPELENFNFFIDSHGEFGDMYGVRLKGEPFDGELTKAIILISKDGAIFYDQFCDDLSHQFNTDILYRKILAAQLCYTGKGCHE
jgi:thiol peroxidase